MAFLLVLICNAVTTLGWVIAEERRAELSIALAHDTIHWEQAQHHEGAALRL